MKRAPRSPAALPVLTTALLVAGCASAPPVARDVLDRPAPLAWRHAVDAFNDAGIAHSQRGEMAQAEQAFRAALTHAPEDARTHNNLGYLLLVAGRVSDARMHLERAVALDLRNGWAQANLRLAQHRLTLGADVTPYPAAPSPSPSPVPQAGVDAVARIAPAPQEASPTDAEPASPPEPTVTLRRITEGIYELRAAGASRSATALAPPPAPAPVHTSAPTATSSAAVAAVPAAGGTDRPQRWRLEVANGNGGDGLARRVAAWLERPARLTNVQPYGALLSRIEHVPGADQAARDLNAHLPVALPLVPVARLDRADVRVLLGKDFPREPGSLATRAAQYATVRSSFSQP